MVYYDYILSGAHKAYRTAVTDNLATLYASEGLSAIERITRRFTLLCDRQVPHILPGQQIVFMRTTANAPSLFTETEWAEISGTHFIHELGYMSNVTPDYARILSRGLLSVREEANEYGRREIDALLRLSDRYRDEAVRVGRDDVAEILTQIPRYPARNLREALQFFRILHYAIWLEGTYHVTCGRFDKYMRPYYEADKDRYTDEELLSLLRDFFLSFNVDSDMYPGVQQGDNGQSMVLGGIDENGADVFSPFSELCLRASGENLLIDPKINMRVSKNTPMEQYIAGSRLTARGMGFPQYSNDDVVIPGLTRLGYRYEDAVNYGVAACWEFIVPGKGCDVANIAALSFPQIVDTVLHGSFRDGMTKTDLQSAVRSAIAHRCDEITSSVRDLWFIPAPFLTLFFDCPDGDISRGSLYNNFGIHGTGAVHGGGFPGGYGAVRSLRKAVLCPNAPRSSGQRFHGARGTPAAVACGGTENGGGKRRERGGMGGSLARHLCRCACRAEKLPRWDLARGYRLGDVLSVARCGNRRIPGRQTARRTVCDQLFPLPIRENGRSCFRHPQFHRSRSHAHHQRRTAHTGI